MIQTCTWIHENAMPNEKCIKFRKFNLRFFTIKSELELYYYVYK